MELMCQDFCFTLDNLMQDLSTMRGNDDDKLSKEKYKNALSELLTMDAKLRDAMIEDDELDYTKALEPTVDRELQVLQQRKDETESKLKNLQKKFDLQNQELKNVQTKIDHVDSDIVKECNKTTEHGIVLTDLIWLIMKNDLVLQNFLNNSEINTEFFQLMDKTFYGFIKFSEDVKTLKRSNELKLVISFMGTLSNITSCPDGRDFIISTYVGKNILEKVTKLLKLFHSESFDGLQWLILVCIYNITMNFEGLSYVKSNIFLKEYIRNMVYNNSDKISSISKNILRNIKVCFGATNICSIGHRKNIAESSSTTFSVESSLSSSNGQPVANDDKKIDFPEEHRKTIDMYNCEDITQDLAQSDKIDNTVSKEMKFPKAKERHSEESADSRGIMKKHANMSDSKVQFSIGDSSTSLEKAVKKLLTHLEKREPRSIFKKTYHQEEEEKLLEEPKKKVTDTQPDDKARWMVPPQKSVDTYPFDPYGTEVVIDYDDIYQYWGLSDRESVRSSLEDYKKFMAENKRDTITSLTSEKKRVSFPRGEEISDITIISYPSDQDQTDSMVVLTGSESNLSDKSSVVTLLKINLDRTISSAQPNENQTVDLVPLYQADYSERDEVQGVLQDVASKLNKLHLETTYSPSEATGPDVIDNNTSDLKQGKTVLSKSKEDSIEICCAEAKVATKRMAPQRFACCKIARSKARLGKPAANFSDSDSERSFEEMLVNKTHGSNSSLSTIEEFTDSNEKLAEPCDLPCPCLGKLSMCESSPIAIVASSREKVKNVNSGSKENETKVTHLYCMKSCTCFNEVSKEQDVKVFDDKFKSERDNLKVFEIVDSNTSLKIYFCCSCKDPKSAVQIFKSTKVGREKSKELHIFCNCENHTKLVDNFVESQEFAKVDVGTDKPFETTNQSTSVSRGNAEESEDICDEKFNKFYTGSQTNSSNLIEDVIQFLRNSCKLNMKFNLKDLGLLEEDEEVFTKSVGVATPSDFQKLPVVRKPGLLEIGHKLKKYPSRQLLNVQKQLRPPNFLTKSSKSFTGPVTFVTMKASPSRRYGVGTKNILSRHQQKNVGRTSTTYKRSSKDFIKKRNLVQSVFFDEYDVASEKKEH